MKPYLFFVLLLLCTAGSKAQSKVVVALRQKMLDNRMQGVKLQVLYYLNCTGNQIVLEGDTICHPDEVKYLLWTNGDKSHLQRFDECKVYQPVVIENNILAFVRSNYRKIEKAKLLPPTINIIVNGKKTTTFSAIDHSCHYLFEIQNGSLKTYKDLNDYDLGTKQVDKHPNKYYQHNQHSVLNKMRVMFLKGIKQFYQD